MLRIFANFLFTYYLYSRSFTGIFVMWNYVFVLKCASDVTTRGASACMIKS